MKQSWGLYPEGKGKFFAPENLSALQSLIRSLNAVTPRGNGRSYGDSALGKNMISTKNLTQVFSFDTETGIIHCEAGLLFDDLLKLIVPKGFFPPVTPGTKFISVGGALASDVHGKNHHKDGCFSDAVAFFELLDENGNLTRVEPHDDLFKKTAGGMGLTGFIYSVCFQLKPISSAFIRQKNFKAKNLDEIFDLFEANEDWTYSVAWIDCLKGGSSYGRSVLLLGEHAEGNEISATEKLKVHKDPRLFVPFYFPAFALNGLSVKIFNFFYYNQPFRKYKKEYFSHYEGFFYPLDAILHWNRIYGKWGFLQYQFVIPKAGSREAVTEILEVFKQNGEGSFLAVLKLFGESHENRYYHFPMKGYTLAVDFRVNERVMQMLETCDEIVNRFGGKLYLTKDARMSAKTFEKQYPDKILPGKYRNDQFKRLMEKPATASESLLVLGANSDMAKAYAKQWRKKHVSAPIYMASRNTEALQDFIQSSGLSNCDAVVFDAADFDSHKAFYEGLANKPSEVLYAAGAMSDNSEATEFWQQLEAMIDVNFKGAVSILNLIAADVDNINLKRIVGLSSLAGVRIKRSNYLYGMTKAGFTAYLRGLRQELHDRGIVVQSVEPGFVATKLTAGMNLNPSLLMPPEDVAGLIAKDQKTFSLVPGFKWKIIRLIISLMPEFLVRKM